MRERERERERDCELSVVEDGVQKEGEEALYRKGE